MNLHIKKVAVLGSGIMGSSIACHLANVGMEVILLDMVTPRLNNTQKKIKDYKDQLVKQSLAKVIKSKPSPLYTKALAQSIRTGNFEDDMPLISDCDWIIEVIIEDLAIKKTLFQMIETFRKRDAIVTSNTSGIPIDHIAEGLSIEFKEHFFGTHFFNPPRYLRLLEVIPGKDSKADIIDAFMAFGKNYLGKQVILCKNSPGFIANRVGIFSLSKLMDLTEEFDFDIETTDTLTGTIIGRPKSGTFRLQDLIGIDTGIKVLQSVSSNCPNDNYLNEKSKKELPDYVKFLMKNSFFGNKSGKGFYFKTKERDELGRSKILSLDLKTLEYRERRKKKLESIKSIKNIDNLANRIKSFFEINDEGSSFIQKYFISLFAYVANRIPEISDHVYGIDIALKAGYGWEAGPFEYWDFLGLEKGIEEIRKLGLQLPLWIEDMHKNGFTKFYKYENASKWVYDPTIKDYIKLPGSETNIILSQLKDKVIFKNSEARILDIGEGVLCLEFTSKNNVLGEGTGEAMNKAIDIAEEEGWKGLVIGNNAANFTVGANLMMIAMHAYQKDWKKISHLVTGFQDVNMRFRYSSIPVVSATKGYVFGGGIEMSMHADSIQAAAESYIGLVETGVGLIPGGGGTKEFTLRLSDSIKDDEVYIPKLTEMFRTIAMAQVATSAHMAFDFKYLMEGRDDVVLDPDAVIYRAKQKVIAISNGYLQPSRKKIKVLGKRGLAALLIAINEFKLGNFISEHDALIARKTAEIMCGGELSAPQLVDEQYLLDMEKEAFLSLCGEEKTMARIQHMLQYNKPLRN